MLRPQDAAVHPSIHPSIHPSVHPSICPSVLHRVGGPFGLAGRPPLALRRGRRQTLGPQQEVAAEEEDGEGDGEAEHQDDGDLGGLGHPHVPPDAGPRAGVHLLLLFLAGAECGRAGRWPGSDRRGGFK